MDEQEKTITATLSQRLKELQRHAEAKRLQPDVYRRLEALVGKQFEDGRSYGHAKYQIVSMADRHGNDITYTLFHYREDGEAMLDGNIIRDYQRTFRINFRRLGGFCGSPKAPLLTDLLRWPDVPSAVVVEFFPPPAIS